MRTFWHDLRLALRTLAKSRTFFLTAVFALVLGIGPNTAIFSIVYATLLAPMPYQQPEELMLVWSQLRGGRNVTSAADYLEWKQRATTFEYLEAFVPRMFNLGTADDAERVRVRLTTAGGHRILGEPMFLGRDFLPDEDQPGRDQVVLISHRLWLQRFDADPNIIGREIRLDSIPHTIVGVYPPGASDRLPAALFKPLAFSPAQINHDVRWLLVKGRLKDGVTREQAQQELNAIAGELAQRVPRSNAGWSVSVEQLQNNFMGPAQRTTLWLLLAAASFVVLIACVNVANLLLARGATRQREMALRASLGASRAQLFRQVMTESLVIAVAGGVLGTLSSVWILRGILAILPLGTLPAEADPRLNVPVLLFTSIASVASGLLFGAAPAWRASRIDLNEALKESGRSTMTGGRGRLGRALVLVECALAVTLLAAAGLAIHSFWNRTRVDLGLRPERVLAFLLPVQPGRLQTPERMDTFYRDLLTRLRAAPGVTHAALGNALPLAESGGTVRLHVIGQPQPDTPYARPTAAFQTGTPDFFATLGIGLTRGRFFTDQDSSNAQRVAVVNERFVELYLAGLDPLRQRIEVEQIAPGAQRPGPPVEWQIVGVFRNVANGDRFGDPLRPEIYAPFSQSPSSQALVAVRTSADPTTVQRSLAGIVRAADPDLPMTNVRTMPQIVRERLAPDLLYVALYGGLAGVALLLAALGVHGVMAFMVAQRTPEIGLRMALGAERRQVLAQVLREGLILAAGGLLFGVAGAYIAGRAMQSTLYQTGTMNVALVAVVGLMLLATALIACYLPARRASTVDPLIALRQ